MFALSLFALVAVLLAGVGVFGVLGSFVAQRSREVGLRVALGATRTQVRRLVLSKIGWPVGLGLVVGTSAACATTPLLRPLLFRVNAFDLSSFAAGWLVLLAITALASLIPLHRAARIDPVVSPAIRIVDQSAAVRVFWGPFSIRVRVFCVVRGPFSIRRPRRLRRPRAFFDPLWSAALSPFFPRTPRRSENR